VGRVTRGKGKMLLNPSSDLKVPLNQWLSFPSPGVLDVGIDLQKKVKEGEFCCQEKLHGW